MNSGSMSPSHTRVGVWVGVVVGVCALAVIVLLGNSPSEDPSDPGPLAAPDDLAPTIATPELEAGWLLGLQTRWDLWGLDPGDGSPVMQLEDVVDATIRGDTLIGRRPGELFASGPHIDEAVEVADQQFVEWVTPNPTMAFTPRPVVLVPTIPERATSGSEELVLSRRSIDGSAWSDVVVDGCGWGYPIVAQTTDQVFAIWCGGSGDLRVFVGDNTGVEETRFGDLSNEHGVGPAILPRGDKPLFIDSAGQIWTLVLSPEPNVSLSGSIDLEDGETITGVAALTADFETLVVGISSRIDLDRWFAPNPDRDVDTSGERITASRFIGFDLLGGRTMWETSSPTPIESIVAAPDGLVYGYRSDPELSGGDLITIDPTDGDVQIIATDLETDPGRLLILPDAFVQHLSLAPVSDEPVAPVATTTTITPSTTTTSAERAGRDSGPLFGVGIYTDALLLFDNGLDGILAVEPDERLAARSTLEGQRGGDEPYSMIRVGDSLVVGWSEIFAVDIATREATSLGLATNFVPAAEPDRVWMIDWPGGAIGLGTPTVWQVGTDGEQLTDAVTLDIDGFPAHGIPGGLAVQSEDGIELWDAASQTARPLPDDSENSQVLDASGNDLVWCRAGCGELLVTDLSTMTSEGFSPDGFTFITNSSYASGQHLSPDGRFVAVLVRRTDGDHTSLWLLDRANENTVMVSDEETQVDFLTWGSDWTQIFATSYSYGLSETTVWRYDLETGHFASETLPFGGALTPIAVDASVAGSYITEVRGVESGCERRSVAGTLVDDCWFRF